MRLEPLAVGFVVGKLADHDAVDGRPGLADTLDPVVTVHSLRVTALTTPRERGSDIIDAQEFAGHDAPRTTLTYIRSRDRLSQSPAYVLRY